jgi:hypothetical protein
MRNRVNPSERLCPRHDGNAFPAAGNAKAPLGHPPGNTPETRMLHVWYIYLQNWVIFRVNVGTYSIHGAYGK